MEDFIVHTNGQCFLCSDPVSFQLPAVNKIETNSGSSSVSPSLHSLKCVSQYLKMDMKKVFNEEDSIPPNLLTKVEKSKLKVELCERCVSINETFLKLFRQLEKIEMEVSCCLETMLGQLLIGTKSGKSNTLLNFPDNDSKSSGWDGRLKVAEVLRAEAREKCSSKLSNLNVAPKVKVQNLTTEQAKVKKYKFKRRTIVWRAKFNDDRKRNDDQDHLHNLPHETEVYHVKREGNDSDRIEDNGDYDARPIEYDDEEGYEKEQQVEPIATTSVPPQVDRKMLSSSVRINRATGKFQCIICSKEFAQKLGFRRHYEAIHLKIAYKCGTCGKKFLRKPDYLRHNRSAHLGIRFKCRFCNVVFTQKNNLTMHQQTNRCKGRAEKL